MKYSRGARSFLAVAALVSVAGCSGVSDPPSSQSALIAIHAASEDETPDWIPVGFEGGQLYLDPDPILTDADMTAVDPLVRPGQLILKLEMSEAASQRMRERTAEAVGQRMAILVDGELRSAPVIRAAIGGPADLPIPASDQEVARLADLVRSRWP